MQQGKGTKLIDRKLRAKGEEGCIKGLVGLPSPGNLLVWGEYLRVFLRDVLVVPVHRYAPSPLTICGKSLIFKIGCQFLCIGIGRLIVKTHISVH